jgi:hypothetical protein
VFATREATPVALLKPKAGRSVRTFDPRPYTLGCPYNGHQTGWCRGLCQPAGGIGSCGRLAPHGLRSRLQDAIARHEAAR